MFKISVKQRLAQLFCMHNYFAIAMGVYEDEKKAVVYECIYCGHVRMIK
jgi:hypothetical protein